MLLILVLNSTCGKSKLYHICFLSNISLIILYSLFPVFCCVSIPCIQLSFHLQCFCNVDSFWNKGFYFLHKLFYCSWYNWIHRSGADIVVVKSVKGKKQRLYFHPLILMECRLHTQCLPNLSLLAELASLICVEM